MAADSYRDAVQRALDLVASALNHGTIGNGPAKSDLHDAKFHLEEALRTCGPSQPVAWRWRVVNRREPLPWIYATDKPHNLSAGIEWELQALQPCATNSEGPK